MNRSVLAYALLAAYVLIVFIATVFHAHNYSWYTNNKGGESIVYLEFLFFTSTAFQGLMWWVLKDIKIAAAILSTLVNLFVAGLITGLGMWGLGIEGTSKNLVMAYGVVYMGIFSAIAVWQIRKADV